MDGKVTRSFFDLGPDWEFGLSLAACVNSKYRPVFDKLPKRERAAVALYFLPHGSKKDVLEVTRPHVVKWYCPFADQQEFPSGHRYCINVYTGCEHQCEYCYAAGYVAGHPERSEGSPKPQRFFASLRMTGPYLRRSIPACEDEFRKWHKKKS